MSTQRYLFLIKGRLVLAQPLAAPETGELLASLLQQGFVVGPCRCGLAVPNKRWPVTSVPPSNKPLPMPSLVLPPERWTIVTSASERVARHRLSCADLPLPAVLVGAEAVSNGKPDPEPYLLGAERLGVSPARCLVFEDAPAGIESALRAGCTVVQVGGEEPLNPAVVAVIRDWREVKVELGEGESLLVTLPA